MADPATLVPLLFALPLVGAALVRLPPVHAARRGPDVVAVVAAGATSIAGGIVSWAAQSEPVVHHLGGWRPDGDVLLGVPFVADLLAGGFATLASVLTTVALLHLAVTGARGGGLTHVLTLVLLGSVNGFVLAGDLFAMAVFIELMGITVYALTAGKTDDPAAVPAALNYAVVTAVGAVLLLLGVGLFHDTIGTPNLATAARLHEDVPLGAPLAVAIALIGVGFAIKAGLAPFHFAHVDLHTATTVQHAGLFGAVLLPVGIYGLARLHTTVLATVELDPDGLRSLLVGAGLLTALVGGVLALSQNQLKRLLAFSSVSHLGIVGVGVGLLEPEATAATALYVLGHGPVKLALLLTAGLLLHQLGTVHVRELAGRAREVPAATALLAIGGLLLAGTPPAGLFAGKSLLGHVAEDQGRYLIVPLLYTAAILTGAAVLRVVVHLLTDWTVPDDPLGHVAEHHGEPEPHTSPALVAIPAVLLAAGLIVAVVPGVADLLPRAAEQFHEGGGYVAAVLDEPAVAPGPTDPLDIWDRAGLTQGLLAGVAAVTGGLAAARWRHRSPASQAGAPLRWLRVVHGGHIGDHSAWLSVGIAAWCGWALFAVNT